MRLSSLVDAYRDESGLCGEILNIVNVDALRNERLLGHVLSLRSKAQIDFPMAFCLALVIGKVVQIEFSASCSEKLNDVLDIDSQLGLKA